jgi:hypothetical protein
MGRLVLRYIRQPALPSEPFPQIVGFSAAMSRCTAFLRSVPYVWAGEIVSPLESGLCTFISYVGPFCETLTFLCV